jgi:hypothetical protein
MGMGHIAPAIKFYMGMGHIAPVINKVLTGHGTYSPCNK